LKIAAVDFGAAFLKPDERIYFAGDYCSHLLTWQEGAALSAHRTVKMIGDRVRQ
jgi:monoamine oxidase